MTIYLSILRSAMWTVVVFVAGSCGGSEDHPAASERGNATVASAARTDTRAPRRRAVVTLGKQTFELDRVFCVPGMKRTAIATDSRQRAGYPKVRLTDFADEQTELLKDQASFDFRHGEERMLWHLEDGDVVDDGEAFTASGTLRGQRMMKNPDGTESSAPLEGNGVIAFTADVRCK